MCMINCSERAVTGWGGAPAGAPAGVDPNVYQWFLTVDADHSGRINMMELQQALVNANWTHFNPETCRLMIGELLGYWLHLIMYQTNGLYIGPLILMLIHSSISLIVH